MTIQYAAVAAVKDDRLFSWACHSDVESENAGDVEETLLPLASTLHKSGQSLLEKIRSQPATSRMSYVYDDFNFHYIIANEVIFLCAAAEGTERKSVFSFLEESRKGFVKMYIEPLDTLSADTCQDYASQVLGPLIEGSDAAGGAGNGKLKSLQGEILKVKGIMVDNIDKVLERGDRIQEISERSENLEAQAMEFSNSAQRLRKVVWWKNFRVYLVIFAVVAVVALIIAIAKCGITFSSCGGGDKDKGSSE